MFVNSLLAEFWYGLFIGVKERFKRFCMIKKRKEVYKRLIVGCRNNITLKNSISNSGYCRYKDVVTGIYESTSKQRRSKQLKNLIEKVAAL